MCVLMSGRPEVSKREAVEAQANDIAKPKTISNLGHAALLRRCELPLETNVLNQLWGPSS
jgi:hypothetical protein